MSDDAERIAVLCKEELPYVKTASSPARTPRCASRDCTDSNSRLTTTRRVLRDDTDELESAVIVITSRRRCQSAPASTPVSVYNASVIKSNANMLVANATNRQTVTMPP